MSDTSLPRASGRPSSVRARRSAIDHIADHDSREFPGLLEEPTADASALPTSTFSIVPQALPATIDEDLTDDDVVASEVRPEEAPSAALDEVRAPVTEPTGETPVVIAEIDAEPHAKPAGAARSRTPAPPKKTPAASKTAAPKTPGSKTPGAAAAAGRMPAGKAASQAPAGKASAPKGLAEKTPAPKGLAEKTPAPKGLAEKTPAPKAPAGKVPASKSPASKSPAPKAPATKTAAPKAPAGKAPAPRTAPAPASTSTQRTKPESRAGATASAPTATPAKRSPRAKRPDAPAPVPPVTDVHVVEDAPTDSGSAVQPTEEATSKVRSGGTDDTAVETTLRLASPVIVVDLPPTDEQEIPADELAIAIEEEPVTTAEELAPRTSSVSVVAEADGPSERDESIDEPASAPSFAGMSVARALAGAPESSSMLTAERLLDDRRDHHRVPEGFWQKLLFDLSGRRIRVADSKSARARTALTARIAKPLTGSARFVPVLTRKGGVGKTTVTTLLGMALADARDDRVIAIDANPDRGTLAERIARRSDHTVRDLVRGADEVVGYTEFSALVSRDETRLDVLASDTDPHLSHAFDEEDYDVVARLASQYYSIVLTDCGTGIVHSVMRATLRHADALVVVSGTSVDEARSAAETVSWLEANGYPELAANAVVVINSTTPGTPAVRLDEIEKHFESRVRSIVRVPFDPQLATGAAISFADLRPETRLAVRELSAVVVEGLPARRSIREQARG